MCAFVTEYGAYDEFARGWHAETLAEQGITIEEARSQDRIDAEETRLLWQVLGELDDEELLLRLPAWLAEANVGFVDGATPTRIVGRIERETDKAIRVVESAPVRPLLKRADRIHHLTEGIERVTGTDSERREQLERRRRRARREFDQRPEAPVLAEEWLPKSQLRNAARRRE